MSKINNLQAESILDSSGHWTIQVKLTTDDGYNGTASVPSGESVGKYEAKRVTVARAAQLIKEDIAPSLMGQEVSNQTAIDQLLIKMDGTVDKSRLGANTLLVLSEAVAKAGAASQNLPLYKYLACLSSASNESFSLPTPLFNLIEGGAHANNGLDFQEFLLVPNREQSFQKQLEMGLTVFAVLKNSLNTYGVFWGIGDEGGLSVYQMDNESALKVLTEVPEKLGYTPEKDYYLGVDAASAQFYKNGMYRLVKLGERVDTETLLKYYEHLVKIYPIIYLEDPFVEDDLAFWSRLSQGEGDRLNVTGDDLTATNVSRLEMITETKVATAVVVKPNQIGTVTETIDFAKRAEKDGLTLVASHRGAETNSSFIADLAVALRTKYVKFGGPSRGERVAKYNRLLEIERELEL